MKTSDDLRPRFTGISREPTAAVPPQEQVRLQATPHNVRGRGSMLCLGVNSDPHLVRGRLTDHYRAPPFRALSSQPSPAGGQEEVQLLSAMDDFNRDATWKIIGKGAAQLSMSEDASCARTVPIESR